VTKGCPDKKTARSQVGITGSSKVILFFGQIKSIKRLDLLISAMPIVLERHPDAKLLIAGKPWKTDFRSYKNKIHELGVGASCISHIRFILEEEMPNYYCSADLVVLPYDKIYQSAVVLMAMSYGKAVLVSDLPGMKEVIADGLNGFVFPTGDSHALANRICEIFDDAELVTRVAGNGLKSMLDYYSWEDVAKKTADVYSSALGS